MVEHNENKVYLETVINILYKSLLSCVVLLWLLYNGSTLVISSASCQKPAPHAVTILENTSTHYHNNLQRLPRKGTSAASFSVCRSWLPLATRLRNHAAIMPEFKRRAGQFLL